MLEKVKINEVLFLDIETVPAQPNFESLEENYQKHWEKKSAYFRSEMSLLQMFTIVLEFILNLEKSFVYLLGLFMRNNLE